MFPRRFNIEVWIENIGATLDILIMDANTKIKKYEMLIPQIEVALEGCPNLISGMATVIAILKANFKEFFWIGFYIVTDIELLTVGPYQGTVGCLSIPFGKGVCGVCASKEKVIIVKDVSTLDNYIACDSQTRSEIVVPYFSSEGEFKAVLDIDSTEFAAFDDIDSEYLEKICEILGRNA